MFRYIIKSGYGVRLHESKEVYKVGSMLNINGSMWEVVSDLYDFRLTLEDLIFTELSDFENDVDVDPDNVDCPIKGEIWNCTARLLDLVEKYKVWLVKNQ